MEFSARSSSPVLHTNKMVAWCWRGAVQRSLFFSRLFYLARRRTQCYQSYPGFLCSLPFFVSCTKLSIEAMLSLWKLQKVEKCLNHNSNETEDWNEIIFPSNWRFLEVTWLFERKCFQCSSHFSCCVTWRQTELQTRSETEGQSNRKVQSTS